jgi:acetoin utilization deacetylase AcuC-like enzyme
MSKTGIVYDQRFLEHKTGKGLSSLPPHDYIAHHVPHPECHERIANVESLLSVSGFIDRLVEIKPEMAKTDTIEFVHGKAYIDRVKSACQRGGERVDSDGFTPVSPKSYETALISVGGCIKGADSIIAGDVSNVYALIRPPGHHACRDEAMGFCLFNNVAVTAEYLKRKYRIEKIAIIDWDVHHGNGTQSIFYNDPSVLFISLHQNGNFPPDSGMFEETGEKNGKGYTVNIPLEPGTGNEGYAHAFEKIVLPVCKQFDPDFVLVSAGQDCSLFDPLGRNSVTYNGFQMMADMVKTLAEHHCEGKLLIAQEGGYDIIYQAFSTLTIIETLAGKKSGIDKPFDGYAYPEVVNYASNVQKTVASLQEYWEF